jgi:hypothetical protein
MFTELFAWIEPSLPTTLFRLSGVMSDCFHLQAAQKILEAVMLVLFKGDIMKYAFKIYSEVMIHILSLIKRLLWWVHIHSGIQTAK